ncbi:MAG: response regulator transcription factor [Chitinophagales bacterium]
MSIKLLVADDHRLFRAGLITILKGINGVEILGEANDGEELLRLLQVERPDMVLLDINMPQKNGYDVLAVMKKKYARVKVIVVSMYESDSHILTAIESGASGYLHKNAEPDEIEIALNSVDETGFYFNDKVSKAMLSRVLKGKQLRPVFSDLGGQLTDSEVEVLKLVCDGLTSAEIGERTFRSTRTVESIRNELIRKTGAKNVAGLVVFAIANHYYNV